MLKPWTLVIVKWRKINYLVVTDEYVVGWVFDENDKEISLTVNYSEDEEYYTVDIPKNRILKITEIQSAGECLFAGVLE